MVTPLRGFTVDAFNVNLQQLMFCVNIANRLKCMVYI